MRQHAAFVLACLLVPSLLADESPVYRGRTAEEWTEDLTHPNPDRRVEAVTALAKLAPDSEQTITSLIGRLADRSPDVRLHAASGLGRIQQQPERCLPALAQLLSDQDEHVRYSAEWALARIASAIPAERPTAGDARRLDELLSGVESELRKNVARGEHLTQVQQAREWLKPALGDSPAERAVSAGPSSPTGRASPAVNSNPTDSGLSDVLADLRAADKLTQLRAIESLKQRGAVAELMHVWESTEQEGFLHWHVSRALTELGQRAVPALARALRHDSEDLAYHAAQCLNRMGPRAGGSLPELIAVIGDPTLSDDRRETAIWVVESIGPAAGDAAETLGRLIGTEESDSLRAASARALAAIGPPARGASAALLEALHESGLTDDTRIAVAEALGSIAPESDAALPSLLKLLDETEEPFLIGGLSNAIARFGPQGAAAVPRLMELVGESSDFPLEATIRALGNIGPSAHAATPLLIGRLTDADESESVQVAAAVAIGKLGPDSVRALGGQLEHPDPSVRQTVARALVEIGAQAQPASRALLARLADSTEDEELRALAAVALGQIEVAATDVIATLARVVRDPGAPVYLRSMAAVALGKLDPVAAASLAEWLHDPNPAFRVAVAYSVQRLPAPHPAAVPTLVQALADQDARPLAMRALVDVGDVCLPLLSTTLQAGSQDVETRLAALQVVSQLGDKAVPHLLRALNDDELAEAAYWHLRDLGNHAIPHLLAADTTSFGEDARLAMQELVEELYGGIGGGDGEEMWSGGHALTERPSYTIRKAAGGAAAAPRMAENGAAIILTEPEEMALPEPEPVPDKRVGHKGHPQPAPTVAAKVDATGYKTTKVFYGTNRQPLDEGTPNRTKLAWYYWLAIVAAATGLIAYVIRACRRSATIQATMGAAGIVLLCLLAASITAPKRSLKRALAKPGPMYGGEYSHTVEMGYCEVTIPDIHQEGQLEGVSLLRLQLEEDPEKHVVLRGVQRLERDVFFEDLQGELRQRGNSILIFIHGYNVSFEDAARRTAQMSHDLKFAGAPIFYSWPSQANWRKYRVDEKNVELSIDQLKTFLIDIAERSQADTINLIAHSMGNRALTNALKEIEVSATEDEQLFNQVILAAPDIDADIFKQRIAPAIVHKARHITLYASSRDLALVASREFNSGDPRAGDAGQDLVVVPGIETIDVSAGDSSLLGHSYYGDSTSVLRDIELLLRNRPAEAREFLAPVPHDSPSYWRFQPLNTARSDIRTKSR